MMSNSCLLFQTSELGVTEHVEGDPCKFALWVGRTPTSDNKIVLKVKNTSSSTLFYIFCVVKLILIFKGRIRTLLGNTQHLGEPYFSLAISFLGWKKKIIISVTQFTLLQFNPLLPFLSSHLPLVLFGCMSSFKAAREAF